MSKEIETDLLIVAHSWGYSGDLMYHGETFAELRRLVPGLAIGVDAGIKYRNPHGLRLLPLFRLFWFERTNSAGYCTQAFNIASPMLVWRIAKLRPRVLMTMEFTPIALLSCIGSLFSPRTRRVQLVESDPKFQGGGKSRFNRMVRRWIVKRAHLVMTSNDAGARYCRETLGVPDSRLVIAPYQVSGPPGAGSVKKPAAGSLRIVFANGLIDRKNPGLLIDALALLPSSVRKGVELTMVGDGEQRPALERKVIDMGLTDIVQFVGRIEYADLARYFGPADVIVSSSRIDFRSLTSFEGLAFGCAVLVSDADGAAWETVIDGKTGFVFPSGDAAALAKYIAILEQNRPLLAAMQSNAARLYADKFSNERAAFNYASAAWKVSPSLRPKGGHLSCEPIKV